MTYSAAITDRTTIPTPCRCESRWTTPTLSRPREPTFTPHKPHDRLIDEGHGVYAVWSDTLPATQVGVLVIAAEDF